MRQVQEEVHPISPMIDHLTPCSFIIYHSKSQRYIIIMKRMSLYDQLPEYGKELLRALDPKHELDRLECNICSDYFNFDIKKPVFLCLNKLCAYEHGICEQCIQRMISKFEKEGMNHMVEPQPLKCPFCNEVANQNYEFDESRFELIGKLSKVIEKLQQISQHTKVLTEQQTEKKLQEVVERAEKDIFNISTESKRKDFLLNRLKSKIESTHRQSELALRDIDTREKDLLKREQTFQGLMEGIMNHQKELEGEIKSKDKLIESLKEENSKLKQRLAEFEDIRGLELRTVNTNQRNQSSRANILYNDDYYFTQFQFHPRRDESFLQNFNEKRPLNLISLKPDRQKYFNAIGDKKIAYNSQLFDYSNEQHRLICFQVRSHNKNVTRYKFGLADQYYKEIKNANLSIYFNQVEEEESFTIMFYVNLIKMKLYATSRTLRKSQSLPSNLKLGKFTVFLYFVDIQTQLTFK